MSVKSVCVCVSRRLCVVGEERQGVRWRCVGIKQGK